ncbi:MAG: hypothetical protein AAB953_01570 [Patescibacteria group bacterium]
MGKQEDPKPDLMGGFDLGRAIRDFAQPQDLNPRNNQPVTWFRDSTSLRTCYRRGEFVPSGDNAISMALRAHEEGNRTPLIEIAQEVREKLGVDIDLQSDSIMELDTETGAPTDTGRTIITNLILHHGKGIERVLGFSV